MRRLGGTLPSRVAAASVVSLLAGSLLAGCSSSTSTPPVGATRAPTPTVSLLPVPVNGDAPPVSVSAQLTFGKSADGTVLPNRSLTPGSAFPNAREADVCGGHYGREVRPVQFRAKSDAFTRYEISTDYRDLYLVDHLIPSSLGGDNTAANLWPQPSSAVLGVAAKDALEAHLLGLVCSGRLSLAQARGAISSDWSVAYKQYMSLPVPPIASSPRLGTGKVAVVAVLGARCSPAGTSGYSVASRITLLCLTGTDKKLVWSKRP